MARFNGRLSGALVLDYLLWPVLMIAPMLAAAELLDLGVPNLVMTPLVVGALAAVVVVLERVRPERAEHMRLDQPLWIEAGHLLFGVELGYALALGATTLVAQEARDLMPFPSWPSHWPMVFQLFIAVLLYEATSYWQHRMFHLIPLFWRFHSLHHSGERLNAVRAARFHIVDIAIVAFIAYLPLMLMVVSDDVLALLGVLISTLGIIQHANMRIRTPAWVDLLVCTPAVHRHHHSRLRAEHDSNYGNSVMLFDLLFGTFARPRREGPELVGIENDTVPRGFFRQVFSPFKM